VGEALGTFALVFAGTGAIIVNDLTNLLGHVGVSLVFGLVVLSMVYALSHVSGAHINPAVTIGFACVNRFPRKEVPFYIGSQLAGAVTASTLWMLISGSIGVSSQLGATLPNSLFGWEVSFILEVVITFILMFVIISVATDHRVPRGVTGLAIGLTVALNSMFGGPISGASMNPARSFGPALVSFNFEFHWIYWVAPVVGAVLASHTYEYIRGERGQN
jgi:aquaporin Z